MNLLWGGMLLTGILYGALNGRMQEITDAVLSASREAVTLCVTMTGILAFWQGLMEIAKDAGLTEQLCGKIRPLVRFLFPQIPADHPAYESISMNFIANFLGLGMAANPGGPESHEGSGNARRKAAKRENCERQTCASRNRQPGNVYLPDYEYFLPSADSRHNDRLPEPVRKRESDSRCWTWDCGNGGQYRGGDFVLQDNGPEKLEFL